MTAYTINQFISYHAGSRCLASVASLDAAEEYLTANYEVFEIERDPENARADALVRPKITPRGEAMVVSINPTSS